MRSRSRAADGRPRGVRQNGRVGQLYGAYGVYQIGELQARSWVVIGTLGSILILNYAASYAVQRGVGISSTRA